MPKSMLRMFGIVTMFKGRLVLSQLLLFISALTTVGFATLTQGLVNRGMEAGDPQTLLNIAVWMCVLAVVAGLCMAGAAALGVFFSQGTSYVIRSRMYKKLQTFSFANYDRFSTGRLMVNLYADAINVQNGMLWALMLGLYAPFMILCTLVLVIINTREVGELRCPGCQPLVSPCPCWVPVCPAQQARLAAG